MSEAEIKYEDYKAIIRTAGAGLNSLTYRGRDLVDPFQSSDPRFFRGDLLAPWPNRIGDGRYEVQGKSFTVPINEVDRRTALHGLVFGLDWEITNLSEDSVELEVVLAESDSYPTTLHFSASYKLGSDGLEISVTAHNSGGALAPYGVSIHPYLIGNPDSKVNEWNLTLHCDQVLEVDKFRLLPIALKACEDLNFDFRNGAMIGERFIDHAFKVNENKPRSISITDHKQSGVLMTFDETSGWIQIHTADRDGGESARTCLAVEPMTCPPDAFRSGENIIWLQPGEKTTSSWGIQKLEGEKREE